MVQSKVAVDHVEAIIDGILGPLQRVLYLLRALLMEEAELGFARQNGVHRAQQPIEVEEVTLLRPFAQRLFHGVACLGPFCADLGQCKVTLGQLCPAAVDAVEDVYDDVQGLVLACDLLDGQINVEDSEEATQPAEALE